MRVIEDQSGYKLNIGTHPDFVRQNEITKLCGDPSLLLASTRYAPMYDLEDTIRWMLNKNL